MEGIARDGTRYDMSGSGASTVVLAHGLGLNRHMWRWQIEALSHSYRVVTYDLYGHGDSPAPPQPPSLSLFSRQVLALLDDLDISKAALLGFSLGGLIALRFSADHMDRLWALGVLHAAFQRDDAARRAIQARVDQARLAGPAATVDGALERWFGAQFRLANPDIMALVRTWVRANDPKIYPDIYQVLIDGADEVADCIGPVSCPALVMTAEEDLGNSPEMSKAIASAISAPQPIILPGLRHMAMIEAPDVFNRPLLDFLQSCLDSNHHQHLADATIRL